MRLRFAGGIVFFAVVLFFPISALGETPLIRMLQIVGTRRPLELSTRAGEPFDPVRVEGDVRRLWATGWFDDISVESAESADGIQLTFNIVERPRLYLRSISFEPPADRRPVALERGTRVDAVVAARVAGELRRQLVEEGYAKARVEAELVPAGFQQADLHLRVERGPAYRVREVRFSGRLGLKPEELRRALRGTRSRTILPGLGPLWGGWRLLALFSEQRLQADLERLRSLYFSRGYFDARVEIARLDVADGKATATIEVDSGLRYRVGQIEVAGAQPAREISPALGGELPARQLCDCLFNERHASEKRGEMGFAARLRVESAPESRQPVEGAELRKQSLPEQSAAEPWVTLKAEIETGPVYRVGRIEFRGHHAVSDSTFRRAMVLREGELFDQGKLRRSLARLNQLGLIQPLAESDVELELERAPNRANLTIPLKENPRGRWALSGPLGPVSVLPLAFTIASRLPGVGRGPLELSTYHAEFSLLAWPQFLTLWPLAQQTRWLPLLSLERPLLPGQEWQSGFVLTPQWGWKGTAAHYAYTHLMMGARNALDRDSARGPGFSVSASWSTRGSGDDASLHSAGLLQCEPRRSTWARLRDTGFSVADLAGKWLLTASLL